MAVAKKCDRCGKYYEGTMDNSYKTEEGFYVNSIRIGNWDARTKSWRSISSAYDLCKDCGREITECVMGKGNMQMHAKVTPKKAPTAYDVEKEVSGDVEVTENE